MNTENPLWLNDAVQFPRLLTAILDNVHFSQDIIADICQDMDDLPEAKFHELLDRAAQRWEEVLRDGKHFGDKNRGQILNYCPHRMYVVAAGDPYKVGTVLYGPFSDEVTAEAYGETLADEPVLVVELARPDQDDMEQLRADLAQEALEDLEDEEEDELLLLNQEQTGFTDDPVENERLSRMPTRADLEQRQMELEERIQHGIGDEEELGQDRAELLQILIDIQDGKFADAQTEHELME